MNFNQRLISLERAAGLPVPACPSCRTVNPCSVVLSISNDGAAVQRCNNCGADRSDAKVRGPLKAYPAAVVDCIVEVL